MARHYIAFDTHCSSTDMAVVNQTGKVIKRHQCMTTIPALLSAVGLVSRPRSLTFEEGPLASWLSLHLRQAVDELIVCDPRRNALIAKEGDKDDPLDALKLAQLFRGGYLKPVHQVATQERAVLKQHVALYHDRVRDRVRQGHQIIAQLRRHGVMDPMNEVVEESKRSAWWKRLPNHQVLHHDLQLLLAMYGLYWFVLRTGGRVAEHVDPISEEAGAGTAAGTSAGLWLGSCGDVLCVPRHASSLCEQVEVVALLRDRPGEARERPGADADAAEPAGKPSSQGGANRRRPHGDQRRLALCPALSTLDRPGALACDSASQRGATAGHHPVDSLERRRTL